MNKVETTYQNAVASWRARDIQTREQLADALDDFRLRFAYNSGRIENELITYHDTRDVFENGKVTGFSGDVRTLFEIQNLRECHELMLDAFAANRLLDEPLVQDAHRTLTQGTYDERRWARGERPGTYKQNDYVVGPRDSGAAPESVAMEVSSLLEEISAANDSNILTVAAYFHLTFESIHPFADGNGRAGRELMNYLLITHHHPPVIVFDEDKLAYYGAIGAFDSDADIQPMKSFLQAETVKTWCKL